MKALIVSEDEKLISRAKKCFEDCGYDTIIYRWLLKALDNVEEIEPHVIFINVTDYPRHWKLFAQYANNMKLEIEPKIILCISGVFLPDDQKKAQALNIKGVFPAECSDGDLKSVINNLTDS